MVDLPDFDEMTLCRLAREMVMNIRSYNVVFSDYGIDEEQYYLIEKNEFYRKVKEQYTLDWNATASTPERLKIGSQAYLEQVLPVITRRALDEREPLASVATVGRLLAQTAGLGENRQEQKNNERFIIQINLGADVTETYNKSIEINPNDVDPGTLAITGREKDHG